MNKELKLTSVVRKALTTTLFAGQNQKKGGKSTGSNKDIIGPGAQLLREKLIEYIIETLKLKFPHNVIGKTFNDENLASVFDILKIRYNLEIQDASNWYYELMRQCSSFQVSTEEIRAKTKSDLVKALAYAVYFEQKEIFFDIVNEIEKTISTEGDPVYKMKCVLDDAGDGFLESHLLVQPHQNGSGKKMSQATLEYKEVKVTAIGIKKSDAIVRACQKWLEQNSIAY